jgi:hypothetical protein
MEAIITIEPTLGDPGLIAYECPKCVYVTSELVQHVTLPTNGGPPPSWNRLAFPQVNGKRRRYKRKHTPERLKPFKC